VVADESVDDSLLVSSLSLVLSSLPDVSELEVSEFEVSELLGASDSLLQPTRNRPRLAPSASPASARPARNLGEAGSDEINMLLLFLRVPIERLPAGDHEGTGLFSAPDHRNRWPTYRTHP